MSRQSNPDAAPQIDDSYELLTTIKFGGSVIKPPAIIQVSDAEAAQLVAKGYISASKVLAPKHVSQDETGDVKPNAKPTKKK